MERSVRIKDTIAKIHQLPYVKIQEINDFAEFLLNKNGNKILLDGIQKLASDSKSFDYLKNEENFYSVKDLKDIPGSFASETSLAKDWLKPEEDEVWKDL
jgi:hypothetical protein